MWSIKSFPGGREFMLRCHFNLPSVQAEDDAKGKMPPIKVKFEIPYYTVSGIQVGTSNRVGFVIWQVVAVGGQTHVQGYVMG